MSLSVFLNKKFILFIFLVFAVGLYSQSTAKIVYISDGDTYTIQTPAGEKIKVRLFGIDCPESDQPFGQEAKSFAMKYLNTSVTYVSYKYDPYGRLIADLYFGDTKINQELVVNGLAWHYKRYSNDSTLAAKEIEARNKKIGLWSSSVFVAPWEWRRYKK